MSPASTDDPPADGSPERAPVEVRVYRFSGPQFGGLFSVPESWCRECDLFVRAADEAAEQAREAGIPVDVNVLPWWSRFLAALRYGGYHPPVMVVDGTRIAQGEDVPGVEEVVAAIEAAARREAT